MHSTVITGGSPKKRLQTGVIGSMLESRLIVIYPPSRLKTSMGPLCVQRITMADAMFEAVRLYHQLCPGTPTRTLVAITASASSSMTFKRDRLGLATARKSPESAGHAQHILAVKFQVLPLTLGKRADVHVVPGIDAHLLEGSLIGHWRHDQPPGVLEGNEALVK